VDGAERLGHAVAAVGAGRRPVEQVEGLGDQALDPPAGIEAAIGILEHDLDAGTEGAGHARHDRLAEQADVAALHRVEAEDRAGQGGLAAARFPHEAEAFALVKVEGYAVDGDDRWAAAEALAPSGIGAGDVIDLQEGLGARRGGAVRRVEEAARRARV
jgi:hypothetical protein